MVRLESELPPGPGSFPGLEIRLLGPVSLARAGEEVVIRSPKQRVILAMLALSRRVTVDAIADALWRDTPPASVAATIHTLVSRLRRTLQDAGGGAAIRSEGVGYVLDADPERVDVHRFEAGVARGRRCLAEGSLAEGSRWLSEALSLWRGPALEDVADRDFARVAATRLDEARVRAAEELAEAQLARGMPADALEVIEPLVVRYPFHEGLRAQQMVALYRLGRQADALAAFQDVRRCLKEELGLEPTPALGALERRILLQAPELNLARADDRAEADWPDSSLTSFVGRDRELAELAALLAKSRLVTISGVGGTGKTRLALELAARCGQTYADGATVVELAPVGDDRSLAGVVLTALGLDAGGSSADAAGERLLQALAERHSLLVLDNCEHLLSSVIDLVDRVVRHCPGVTVVVTSREVLALPHESAWVAPGLSLPPESPSDPAELGGSDAAALFVARARVARPGFGVTPANVAAVADICRRLDGLPLALELAAARVRVLGATQLAHHLEDRFRLLTGGLHSSTRRHRTLEACMDWSYEALSRSEQRLLRRLAIFPQRFDLDAATAVSGPGSDALDVLDLLARLVDKSLLVADGAAETARYRLLETVRQYAARKLVEAREDVDASVLHRRYFVGLVREWHRGGETFTATAWLLREAADRENFHSALVDALEASDTEAVSVLVAGLWLPWYVTGSVPPVLSSIAPEMIGCTDPSLHIDALIGFNVVPKMTSSSRSLDDLGPLLDRALTIADEQGRPRDQGWARCMLGYVALGQGDLVTARALLQEALSRYAQEDFAFGLSYAHYELGWVDMTAGEVAGAGRHFRCALAFSEATTGYEIVLPAIRASLALAEAAEGRTLTALDGARRAVQSARELPFPGVLAMALVRSAETGAVAGVPARRELAEAVHLLRRQGGRHWVAGALTVAALLHEGQGRHGLAARLLGGAVAVAEELGEDPQPMPVVQPLVTEARRRLREILGAEFTEQENVGRHTAAASLLRAAAEGLDA